MNHFLFFCGIVTVSLTNLCADWSDAETLSDQTYLDSPKIAVSSNNYEIAIWRALTSAYRVQARVYNGSTWSSAQFLSPDTQNAQNLAVAINDNGIGMVLWDDATTERVQASVFDGSSFGAYQTIPQPATNNFSPGLGLNNGNKALIGWVSETGGVNSLYGSVYNGTTFSSAANLSLATFYAPSGNYAPSIALNDQNQGVIAWQADTIGENQIIAIIYDNGEFGAPQPISSLGSTGAPKASINASGVVMVAWELGGNIYNAIYQNGAWSDPIAIYEGTDAQGDVVCVLNDYSVGVICWNTSGNLYGSFYENGAWADPVLISNSSQTPLQSLALALNDYEAVVAYMQPVSGINQIHVASSAGRAWSTPETLSPGAYISNTPDIAMNGDGKTTVIWQTIQSGSSYLADISQNQFYLQPPASFVGEVIKNRLPYRTQIFNFLSWEASPSLVVDVYNLSRNGSLLAVIGGSDLLVYEDQNVELKKSYTYSLESVIEGVATSQPITLTLQEPSIPA